MDYQQALQDISDRLTGLDKRVQTVEKTEADIPEVFKSAIAEAFAKQEKEVEEKVEDKVEQKQLRGILEVEIMGMPLGKAFIGGGIALFVSELIDGMVVPRFEEMIGKTWAPALIKGFGAFAVKQWGAGLIGKEAADIACIFLTWEAVRSIIPIDEWLKKLFAPKEGASSESSSSSSHSSESSSGGNGHQPVDAMDMLRVQLSAGGR